MIFLYYRILLGKYCITLFLFGGHFPQGVLDSIFKPVIGNEPDTCIERNVFDTEFEDLGKTRLTR